MTTTCLIDTSVFCNLLNIPGRNQESLEISRDAENKIRQGWKLLLPFATIIETGNHIAHVPDGRVRRQVALRFVRQVEGALAGNAPWTLTNVWTLLELQEVVNNFPNHAGMGLGIADASIIAEYQRLADAAPHHRIIIWSLDQHLSSYDTGQ